VLVYSETGTSRESVVAEWRANYDPDTRIARFDVTLFERGPEWRRSDMARPLGQTAPDDKEQTHALHGHREV
jgi:hypothetical protein